MRTKTAWEVVETSNGKKAPQKIGLKPEQREGMEYEFTLVLDLALEGHIATASKDRTSLFDGRHFVPDRDTGEELRGWLETGRDPEEVSGELLAGLLAAAEQIESAAHLDNWGRKHRAGFDRLLPEHRQQLVAYCAGRKQELLQAA